MRVRNSLCIRTTSYSDFITLFMLTYIAILKLLLIYVLIKAKISLKILAAISNYTLQTLIHSKVVSSCMVWASGSLSYLLSTPIRNASTLTLWKSCTISCSTELIQGRISYSRPMKRPRESSWVKIRSSWSIFSSTDVIFSSSLLLKESSLTNSMFLS